MSSLFERIGGDVAVAKAVDIFYDKVLADDRISAYFEGIDMVAQERKQTAFLTMVFGGPTDYTGKDMRAAHAQMHLEDVHFDAVVENLAATLVELGVSGSDISEVAAVAESVRGDVLNR